MVKKNIKKILIGLGLVISLSSIFFIFTKSGNEILLKICNRKKVIIEVDGQLIKHITKNNIVKDILEEIDITMDSDDKINKSLDEEIDIIEEIVINRIEVKNETIDEKIPFEEINVQDYKTNLGEKRVISEGEDGEKRVEYEIIIEDGVEKERKIVNEEITKEVINYITATGSFDLNSLSVIVNKNKKISKDYVPEELVKPEVRIARTADSVLTARPIVCDNLEKMFKDAEKENIILYAVSGYRSYSYQEAIYNNSPTSNYRAQPGASEHQLGLAMDVTSDSANQELLTRFGDTKEGKWVEENAHKYGFHIRYLEGKEDITGYYYEPWHLRYLGVELATELHESGLTMEEHFGEY